MPFLEASLKSIYKEAYEIIIVEGAVEKALFASDKGHSIDGTIEFVKSFDDLDKKIKFISGVWPEKCEMQNRALEQASGDYVWLVDSDEIYKEEDLNKILRMLEEDPSITQIDFPSFHFWKNFDTVIDSYILDNKSFPHRVFKLEKPCYFTTHRPPTLFLKKQGKTSEKGNRLTGDTLKRRGIYLYHYSYILEKQVKQKIGLYKRYGWEKSWKIDLDDWFNNCFLKWTSKNKDDVERVYPILTGDKQSKTRAFDGIHPKHLLDILPQVEVWRSNETPNYG